MIFASFCEISNTEVIAKELTVCEISNTEVIAKELTILPNMIFASFVKAYKHWSPLLTTRIAF